MPAVAYKRSEEPQPNLEVWVDEELWDCLDSRVFRRLRPLPKDCVDLTELREFIDAFEAKRAKNGAYRLLAVQSLNSAQLSKKLTSWGYRTEIIDKILEELVQLGYIQDEEWAHQYAAQLHRRRYGMQYIRQKLRFKGVADNLIESALQALDTETDPITELLNSRYRNKDLSDPKEQQRVAASLFRRGFSAADIWTALRAAKVE